MSSSYDFRVRIHDKELYLNCVFGASDILLKFPNLETIGITLRPLFVNGEMFYYILDGGKVVGDCMFFSDNELKYLEVMS
jgi:hypothetical protein|tara:strand:+ start:108 stop:347 length:240 start_codon:yes stop_codon:yes gene_type:complete